MTVKLINPIRVDEKDIIEHRIAIIDEIYEYLNIPQKEVFTEYPYPYNKYMDLLFLVEDNNLNQIIV